MSGLVVRLVPAGSFVALCGVFRGSAHRKVRLFDKFIGRKRNAGGFVLAGLGTEMSPEGEISGSGPRDNGGPCVSGSSLTGSARDLSSVTPSMRGVVVRRCPNAVTLPASNVSMQLESLILAQSERWRQA